MLRALCEITLDSAGVSDRLEEAIRVSKLPPKQRDALLNARPKRGVAPVDAIESFRREPLGRNPCPLPQLIAVLGGLDPVNCLTGAMPKPGNARQAGEMSLGIEADA